MDEKSRFVFQVSGKEIPVGIGGKNFEMSVYDCVLKKFFTVLEIKTVGRTVKVYLGDWEKDILLYE